MNSEFEKIKTNVTKFCNSHESIFLDENITLLSSILKGYYIENNTLLRNDYSQMISLIRKSSDVSQAEYARIIQSIAMDEYESGNIEYSEFLFRYSSEHVNDISYDNNLAYVLRRKDSNSELNKCEIIMLLMNGLHEREPFSIINMALLFALNLSSKHDWLIADELFSLLPTDLHNAEKWWEKLGRENDIEGYLVHFFLLRHKKIENEVFGSLNDLAKLLANSIKSFPDWLSSEYNTETLNS